MESPIMFGIKVEYQANANPFKHSDKNLKCGLLFYLFIIFQNNCEKKLHFLFTFY